MSKELSRQECAHIQSRLELLRDVGEDYLIVSVGVRGPNMDCEEGNAVATIRMGNDEATSEALRLYTAITLARLRGQARMKPWYIPAFLWAIRNAWHEAQRSGQ